MPEPSDIWIVLVGALLALLALYGGFRALRRKRLIGHLPTSRIRGVFIGFVELSGTAEAEAPLTSHLAKARCVHCLWSVQERWSRWVTDSTHRFRPNEV